MRHTVLSIALSLCVVVLAGCDKKSDAPKVETKTQSDGTQSVTVTDNNGTKVTMAGPGASTSMPAYAPMFPGASVEATFTSNKGGMVSFKTSASTQDVITFYKKSAADAGFKDNFNMTQGDAMTFSASKDTHALSVVATKSEDGTHVQVTWN